MRKLSIVLLSLLVASPSYAADVVKLLGPQDPSQLNAVINTLIVSGNDRWNPAGSHFLATNNISANATTTVSYSTSTGPVGLSPVTAVEWLKIRNASGTYRLIPMWGCTGC